jgi:hypothetical protein
LQEGTSRFKEMVEMGDTAEPAARIVLEAEIKALQAKSAEGCEPVPLRGRVRRLLVGGAQFSPKLWNCRQVTGIFARLQPLRLTRD